MLCGQVVTALNIQRDRYPASTDIAAQVSMIKRGVTNTEYSLCNTVPRHVILGGSRKFDSFLISSMKSWLQWEAPHGWRIFLFASLICGPLHKYSTRCLLTEVKRSMRFSRNMFTWRFLMPESARFDDHWRQSDQFKSMRVDADD